MIEEEEKDESNSVGVGGSCTPFWNDFGGGEEDEEEGESSVAAATKESVENACLFRDLPVLLAGGST